MFVSKACLVEAVVRRLHLRVGGAGAGLRGGGVGAVSGWWRGGRAAASQRSILVMGVVEKKEQIRYYIIHKEHKNRTQNAK